MKKFFTLLSAAALATSAFALNIIDPATVKIDKCIATPEVKASIAATHARLAKEAMNDEFSDDTFVSRYTVDGYDYTVVMAYTGFKLQQYWNIYRVNETTGEREIITFEEMPLYICDCALIRSKVGESQRESIIESVVTWPSQRYWDIYQEPHEGDTAIVPLSEIASNPKLCSSFAYMADQVVTFYFDETNQKIMHYALWSNEAEANQTYMGQSGVLAPPTDASYSYFKINSFDTEEQVINMSNNFVIAYGANKSMRGTINVDYEDTGRFLGFEKFTFDLSFGIPHVFNCGPYSMETDKKNPFDFEFNETQRYFIFVPKDCLFVWIKPEATVFNQDDVRIDWQKDLPDNFDKVTNFSYLCGFLYAPKGTTEPNGIYTLSTPETVPDPWDPTTQILKVVPTDWSMIPSGYNAKQYPWSTEASIECVWQSYYQYLRPTTRLGIGTDKGIVLNGRDNYGDVVCGSYTGKYFYHPNPNNMQEYEERDAMGSLDRVESVEVSEEAPVFYDLQGRKVVNPENGLYIRVQGGNATKVML